MLRALGEKDGYVGINFYPAFLSERFLSDPADAALFDEGERVEAAFIADPGDPQRVKAWEVIRNLGDRRDRPGRPPAVRRQEDSRTDERPRQGRQELQAGHERGGEGDQGTRRGR